MSLLKQAIRFGGLLALLTLAAPAIRAQILEADLTVKGLACPFCSYGLERKLKKLPAADSVKILFAENRAQVQFDGKESPDVGDFFRAVHDAGFKLEELRLVVRAKRDQTNGEPCLVLPDGKTFLLVDGGPGNKLIDNAPDGAFVEAKGRGERTEDSRDRSVIGRLRVESYKVIGPDR